MGELIRLQVTIFSLIACGALLKRLRIIGKEGQKDITNLVIYVVLPCNIVNSFLIEFDETILRDCLAILLISIGIQVMAVFYGRIIARGQDPDRQTSLRYAIISSNAGFLGNPIAEGLFGGMGLMLASVFLIPQRVMMWSEGIAIYSGVKDLKQVGKKVVTHPCVLACLIGLILMIGKVQIPEIILSPVQTLGKCNTALSMLVIGMILGDMDLKKLFDKSVMWFTLHRLIIIPAIVWGVCSLLPVSHLATGVSVILSAMPAAATTGMLASKYDRDPEFATVLIIFSTLCSILTTFVWSILVV